MGLRYLFAASTDGCSPAPAGVLSSAEWFCTRTYFTRYTSCFRLSHVYLSIRNLKQLELRLMLMVLYFGFVRGDGGQRILRTHPALVGCLLMFVWNILRVRAASTCLPPAGSISINTLLTGTRSPAFTAHHTAPGSPAIQTAGPL